MARRPLPPFALLTGLAVAAAFASATIPAARAQGGRASGGFDATLPSIATGAEIRSQADLWVMEVDFKPMRLAKLPVTDPETGETSTELVWYLVWRATNRPLQSPVQDLSSTPQNELDAPPGPRPFVPEFVLIGEDGTARQYRDTILPGVLPDIEKRELRGAFKNVKLNTTVTAADDLPPRTPADAPVGEGSVYGVATWVGVDPTTDRFTVLLNGFSNGYEIENGQDGLPVVNRRTGILKFWRPGDEIDENETEFRLGVNEREETEPAAGLPHWEYLPDEAVDSDDQGDVGDEVGDDVSAEAATGFGEN